MDLLSATKLLFLRLDNYSLYGILFSVIHMTLFLPICACWVVPWTATVDLSILALGIVPRRVSLTFVDTIVIAATFVIWNDADFFVISLVYLNRRLLLHLPLLCCLVSSLLSVDLYCVKKLLNIVFP